jgi:hypothetical protein
MNFATQYSDLMHQMAVSLVEAAIRNKRVVLTRDATVGPYRAATRYGEFALYDDRPGARAEWITESARDVAIAFVGIVGHERALRAVNAE